MTVAEDIAVEQVVTPRIRRLRTAIKAQTYFDAEDLRRVKALAAESYGATRGTPEVLRKSRFLGDFARRCPVRIVDDELIVSPPLPVVLPFTTQEREAIALHGNMGHYMANYRLVLGEGVRGLRRRVAQMRDDSDRHRRNHRAFAKAVEAFAVFIRRHVDAARDAAACAVGRRKAELIRIAGVCTRIARSPPASFHEALQLVWFMHLFLNLEGQNWSISFGRFDQYLWPYLERGLAAGAVTSEEATELLACFWLKCCTIGAPPQTIILGGVDEQGDLAENPLSLLCLQVARSLRVEFPSVTVRIGPKTSQEFWEQALLLCAEGMGMPAFFNDPVVIRALQALDIPLARSRDYGVIGCYEMSPQGDANGMAIAGDFDLVDMLTKFLTACPVCASFAELLERLKAFLQAYYAGFVGKFNDRVRECEARFSSPFESVCMTGCTETGRTAEEGGTVHRLFGVNILSLGTLVDSLHVIDELVFRQQQISLPRLIQQVEDDFPDERLLLQCRSVPGRYGSDHDRTNALVADLSRFIADLMLGTRLVHDMRPVPGFYNFWQDILRQAPATPDGRRRGDRISYGAGPGEYGRDCSPTSILSSARWVAHDRAANGNPIQLSFPRQAICGEEGMRTIRDLVTTYFDGGGFHLHFNIVDAETLRAAQHDPGGRTDLIVRVSGFSAQFTTLDAKIQDAIIERTARGV